MRGVASEQTRWANVREAVLFWRAPAIAGSVTALGAWAVWYFTKVPCIMETALAGLCNPSVLASYINLPALAGCLAIGGGFATATGGYNFIMLNRERQRADDAEARLQAERERNDKLFDEMRDQLRLEREQSLEERRQAAEDRRQYAASHQAMMTTLAEISAALAQLVQQQQNGHRADNG